MRLHTSPDKCEYIISNIDSQEADLLCFLESLGCCRGEKICLLSRQKSNFIISLQNVKYSIDDHIASSIEVKLCDNASCDADCVVLERDLRN